MRVVSVVFLRKFFSHLLTPFCYIISGNGKSKRDLDSLLELQLTKVRMQYDVYPENTTQVSAH